MRTDSGRHPFSIHNFLASFLRAGRACLFVAASLLATSSMCLSARAQAAADDEPLGVYDSAGSANVPMDSWVYPALERLSTMDLIHVQMVSIRPWTRQECARQIREARSNLAQHPEETSLAEPLLIDLERELGHEDQQPAITLDSVYTRVGVIVGPAVTNSYYFGQTIWNDFGRPLARGTNAITGESITASKGRFYFYGREEIQRAPATPGVTADQATLFNQVDWPGVIYPAIAPQAASYRATPIELYAGVAFKGMNLSFGKQQLYWGPTTIGPLSFSSNAEPTYNLRLVAARPYRLPLIPSLGTFRFDLVLGKLSGHKYPARPYFNGQKFDFQILNTLELSFTRWSILWGVGHPMTLGSLKRNIFSSDSTGTTFAYGERVDPGDRKSDFDFLLHVPGLRKYVAIYADSYADDEVSPIDAPRRVIWSPGIYVSHLPFASKIDLRFEMASSEELSEDEGGKRFFNNNQYLDANTNKGFLLGNATGRDARTFEARTTYWHSARTTVMASYRQTKGGINYLPGGSTISDGAITTNIGISKEWSAQIFTQYERFLIPAMMPGDHHNVSATLQLQWNPHRALLRNK